MTKLAMDGFGISYWQNKLVLHFPAVLLITMNFAGSPLRTKVTLLIPKGCAVCILVFGGGIWDVELNGQIIPIAFVEPGHGRKQPIPAIDQ